ncbi:EamA family transporter, partial [Chloroflexota bacterium]
LAALGSFSFAISNIFRRKAVVMVPDATIGAPITVALSVVYFMTILIATDQVSTITSFPWQSYLWLSAAGIIHFVVGRSLNFILMQLVGANISNVVNKFSPVVAVVLGLTVLGETLTWQLVVGVTLIIFGLIITGLNPQMFRSGQKTFSGIPLKAYLLGLGVGMSFGITPIMIKLGLGSSSSPVAGAFISYTAATIVFSTFLLNHTKMVSITTLPSRALIFFCLNGLCTATAQLLRYTALSLGPVSVIAPIFNTSPIFTLFLTFLFIRKLEVFSVNVIIGIIIVVVGSILLA